jgi:hypothetical protein
MTTPTEEEILRILNIVAQDIRLLRSDVNILRSDMAAVRHDFNVLYGRVRTLEGIVVP